MRIPKINWELTVGASGIIIAIVSLMFTYHQVRLSEEHNRISVRPRIVLVFNIDSKRDRYGWYMSNSGLGPAYFTQFQLFVDNSPIEARTVGGWFEVLAKLGLKAECFSIGWTPLNTALSNGPEVEEALLRLISPSLSECQAEFSKLVASANRLKVEIHYQSIYGEEFVEIAQPTKLF